MSFPSSPESLAIHLDAAGGIAGDMFVAAMVDAIPELERPVQDALAAVQPAGLGVPAFTEGASGGLRARRFGLRAARARSAPHAHTAQEAAHGTAFTTLRARIASSALPPATREHALALLQRIGDAEARVHGCALDEVHFHELADWDSLLDVVAAAAIAARLAGAQWSASALPLGGGTVNTSHGVLPVPAPVTALLLEGYAWRDDGVAGERVTPTGAAILRHLVAPERCGRAPATGRLARTGFGAGTRELPGVPNVLRALVFDRSAAPGVERVAVIEFDVDDMTGEEIALASDRLRAVAGTIDVSLGARAGKKGRPLTGFRLLVQPSETDAVAAACFRETSTLGLRVREETRRVLARDDVAADQAGVRVKVAHRPAGERTAKAEHDDVAAVGGLGERRELRARAERDAKERR